MDDLAAAAGKALNKLLELKAPHALIGGLAVSARTDPRFTKDVDVAVAVHGDDDAEAIVRAFGQDGYVISAIVEQQATDRLSTVRLRASNNELFVDLLFASSGIEPEIAEAADVALVLGHRMPVAKVGHLIALKLLASSDTRLQDTIDLRELVKVATEEDMALAREAVELIAARGYDRGRDLRAGLGELVVGPEGA